MHDFKFKLGDVVSILSHHFSDLNTKIVYSGDPLQQSPLMVVNEILPARTKGAINYPPEYKCMWFSVRSQKFVDAWISEPLIKLIDKSADKLSEIPRNGSLLSFRTLAFEIQKIKSSFKLEDDHDSKEKRTNNLNPLLSFVSPVLVVSGNKEILDIERKPNLIIEAQLIKVKWFNIHGDKFCETYLPVTSLINIQPIDEIKATILQESIENDTILKVKIENQITLIKPSRLTYLSGIYLLQFFDIVLNKYGSDCNIVNLKIIKTYKSSLESSPKFDFSRSNQPLEKVSTLIAKAIRKKKIIRIKYKNQENEYSVRCLKNIEGHKRRKIDKDFSYITGDCLLKSSERHFRIERISQVELIDIGWKEIKSSSR